jgi:hypothetical protein
MKLRQYEDAIEYFHMREKERELVGKEIEKDWLILSRIGQCYLALYEKEKGNSLSCYQSLHTMKGGAFRLFKRLSSFFFQYLDHV